MSWDDVDKELWCEYGKRGSSLCPSIIAAATHGTALRMAAERGWWRGNRGGLRVDYCADHNPRKDKP